LDDPVEPIPCRSGEWPAPEDEDHHCTLSNQFACRLRQTLAVSSRNYTTFRKHVYDCRYKYPIVLALIGLVEETVFPPCLHVFIESGSVPFRLFKFMSELTDSRIEESEDGRKDPQSDTSEDFCSPGIAVCELEDAVECPDTIEEQYSVKYSSQPSLIGYG